MQTRTKRIVRTLAIVVPLLAVGALALPRALAFGHRHQVKSSEQLAERLSDGIEHVLDEVDATDAQRTRADALVQKRAPELFALMREGRALRSELKQVMLADQLDHAQLDAVRAKLDLVAGKVTNSGLDAVFELSEVLTPAQRKQLAERIARFEK